MAVVPNSYATTGGKLEGLFKTVYGRFHDLLPAGFKLQQDFVFKDALGDTFKENVLLAHESGFTYAAPGDDYYQLSDPTAGQTKPTTVNGSSISLRSYVGRLAAERAVAGGEKAFKAAFDVVTDNMKISTHKRVEIDLLHGQSGIGTVIGTPTVGGGNTTFTVSAATWAPGIWAGMEGAQLEIHQPAFAGKRGATITITAVNLDTRTITCSAEATGTIAGDLVTFLGQYASAEHKSALGLHSILTSTGTLFGVSAATYSLWAPSSYSVAGQLSFQKVNAAVYKAISKGLDEKLCLYCNPNTWKDLIADEAALRRHPDPHRNSYAVGAEGITFYSQNGEIMIKASNYVKEGTAYMLPPPYFKRVGASDVTFTRYGENGGTFLWIPGYEGWELRTFSNQACYSNRPGYGVALTGIVNG